MDQETKSVLHKIAELSRENNELLKKMYRRARLATYMHALYWLIIIGFSLGAYYFVQPYVEKVFSVYAGFQNDLKSINGFKDYFGNIGN